MRCEKRNGFGDCRRTGIVECGKLHGSTESAQPTGMAEISWFFVALAPGPVNDGLLCDAKAFRFC
jgi:hypothetical protein